MKQSLVLLDRPTLFCASQHEAIIQGEIGSGEPELHTKVR